MDPRSCENKTCPHNVGFCACAWGSLDDILDCEHRKQPAPVQPDEVKKQLRDAGAKVVTVDDKMPVTEADSQVDVWGGAANVHIFGLTPARAVAALEVATNGKPRGWCEDCRIVNELAAAKDEIESWKKEALKASQEVIRRDAEAERLKGIIAHNNLEYDAVLGQLRGENFRLTDPKREEEIARLTRDLAAMTKSRDMWHTSADENAAEVARLRGLTEAYAKAMGIGGGL